MFADYGTQDYKQHLNLSQAAYDVAQNDMRTFTDSENFSGFINHVISAYADIADASISAALRRAEEKYRDQFSKVPNDKTKERMIKVLLSSCEKNLIEKAFSYQKGVYTKFRLNKRNFDMIFESNCQEEKYYERPGQYIKAIVEEYAERPQYQRESIFFGDTITLIQSCIQSGTLLIVKTKKGWSYEVRPFAIMTDEGSLYHYLVGYSRLVNGEHTDDKIASFRISQLVSVVQRPKSYRSGRITNNEQERIVQKLQAEGVQFLLGDQTQIKVRLTDVGKKMYASQLHLRPTRVKSSEGSDDIYCFNCTETQARFYFFKFGKEVEIISPQSLRETFIRQYRDAIGRYSDE